MVETKNKTLSLSYLSEVNKNYLSCINITCAIQEYLYFAALWISGWFLDLQGFMKEKNNE